MPEHCLELKDLMDIEQTVEYQKEVLKILLRRFYFYRTQNAVFVRFIMGMHILRGIYSNAQRKYSGFLIFTQWKLKLMMNPLRRAPF
jgi:hypothetical protein